VESADWFRGKERHSSNCYMHGLGVSWGNQSWVIYQPLSVTLVCSRIFGSCALVHQVAHTDSVLANQGLGEYSQHFHLHLCLPLSLRFTSFSLKSVRHLGYLFGRNDRLLYRSLQFKWESVLKRIHAPLSLTYLTDVGPITSTSFSSQ
jgi:hypothetical protein